MSMLVSGVVANVLAFSRAVVMRVHTVRVL
jgi:hypothetical protein